MPVHNYHTIHIHNELWPPTVSIRTKVSYRVCLWGLQERWQPGWHTCQESHLCTETWQHVTFCSTKTSLARYVSFSLVPRPRPPFCCLQYMWENLSTLLRLVWHLKYMILIPFQIGDFGLARNLIDDTYYKSSGGKIPVKWTSPEVAKLKKKEQKEREEVWGGRREREHGE